MQVSVVVCVREREREWEAETEWWKLDSAGDGGGGVKNMKAVFIQSHQQPLPYTTIVNESLTTHQKRTALPA